MKKQYIKHLGMMMNSMTFENDLMQIKNEKFMTPSIILSSGNVAGKIALDFVMSNNFQSSTFQGKEIKK